MGGESEDCDYVWESFPKVTTELTPEGEVGIQLMTKSYKHIARQIRVTPRHGFNGRLGRFRELQLVWFD